MAATITFTVKNQSKPNLEREREKETEKEEAKWIRRERD
jgi:hypothetical protein